MRNKVRFPHQINVNLTEKEFNLLKEKSQSGSISQSEFIRMLITYYPKNLTSMEEILKNLTYEINKIGVNINQLAHKSNIDQFTLNDLETLKVYCKKINYELEKVKMDLNNL